MSKLKSLIKQNIEEAYTRAADTISAPKLNDLVDLIIEAFPKEAIKEEYLDLTLERIEMPQEGADTVVFHLSNGEEVYWHPFIQGSSAEKVAANMRLVASVLDPLESTEKE